MEKLAVFPLLIVAYAFVTHEGDCFEIVGGREVLPHSRPYMAYLNTLCGGALIKPNWVLSAAHCKKLKTIQVTLGAHSRKDNENTKQKFQVKTVVVHPHFNFATYSNDLMLLQLNQSAILNKFVSTLPLPHSGKDVRAGIKCSVAGWGAVRFGNQMEDKLREVNVTVIDRQTCNGPDYYEQIEISRSMLCAGDPKGGKDSCWGDSGSPLLCYEGCDLIYRGIVSFGINCGVAHKPGVYTLLTEEYLRWIQQTIQHYE
ncbi:granzyme A-like [Polypterus senegalus]|nr:granzyme A-like [Polypterus senegalus]